MNLKINENQKKILVQLIILLITILSWLLGSYIISHTKQKAESEATSKVTSELKEVISEIENNKISSDYPDYNSLEDLDKLNLIHDFESWTPNAKKNLSKSKTVIVLDRGSLSQGYLYIKASVEGKPLSRWESIFVQMNYRGGHLLRTKAIPVPASNKTELLYALDDISYVSSIPYKENDEYNKTNWLNLFQHNREIRIDSFISSLRKAKIEEMTLYYNCADDDCSLSIK